MKGERIFVMNEIRDLKKPTSEPSPQWILYLYLLKIGDNVKNSRSANHCKLKLAQIFKVWTVSNLNCSWFKSLDFEKLRFFTFLKITHVGGRGGLRGGGHNDSEKELNGEKIKVCRNMSPGSS
jgi:hypothetical protein